MKQMDGFERSVKDSLDNFEVPYNSADWSRLEAALDGKERAGWLKGGGFYAALVAAGVTVAGGVYLLSTRSADGDIQFAKADPIELVADNNAPNTNEVIVPAPVQEDPQAGKVVPAAVKENKIGATGSEPIIEEPKQQRVIHKKADDPMWAQLEAREKTRSTESSSLTIKPSSNEGCPGTTVEFAAGAAPEGGIFLWNFGDGSFSNKNTPEHTYTKTGVYKVILSLSNTSGGAINNKDASDKIVIYESPDASFTPMKRTGTDNLPTMHFENKSHSGATYHWDFGDGSTSTAAHPDHLFKKRGTDPVELAVTNEKGCVDRSKKDIIITEDYNLMAPPSFSPNGDGTLDRFIPEALRTMQQKFAFLVYDAKGGLLYRTTDATMPWDGSVNNLGTELLPTGQYLWVVDLGNETYNGHVVLVR
ncbi:MAG: PKD domain-containing protein [Flavobacteriales bacterium]|nr:PKD domain-containing protein [Flavobacteriales bacterium]